MKALVIKEMRLSASVLSYILICSAFLALCPGYPILCSAFFTTLGIFHSFQNAREANDIVFSALLPVAKSTVVKGKYLFSVMIEAAAFLVMTILTLLRMTVLSEVPVYRLNALMNANPFFLGMTLLIFGLFNLIFIGGFFKTAYVFSKPFLTYIIIAFLTLSIAEALHHFPGLEALNAFGFDHIILQISLLLAGAILFILLTFVSYRKSCERFERIDL
ncbi:MAG: ABC-2 transporter permease [Clostridia bacterium]|nr:ABC-2 transporter permease [Clostridia bacterium]